MFQNKFVDGKRPKIVILDGRTIGEEQDLSSLAELGELVEYPLTSPEQTADRIADADIVLTNKVHIGEEAMAAAPRLGMIGIFATGYNMIDLEAARRRNIVVCNVRGYSTNSVVQHVFGLLLALASGICRHNQAVQAGEWADSPTFSFWKQPTIEIAGKTMGIVGFGDIGSGVAKVANAFGMEVIAYAPRPKPAPDYGPFAFVELDELFARSDYISLNCPLTAETAAMINRTSLSKMKRSACLINCGRGGLVNEADLRWALEEGIIAGAGLDVAETEPMPRESPLFGAPNCIITPHIAWATVEARERLLKEVAANIRNYLAGTPSSVVN
ncbi:MAG: D-2-hydroxyacid dehydrogenase [Desulfovibrionaceae bacterium]|nr:D-2-hydroxyacid dehydrogenase [Desulfovibrionaceae bacterium]